MNRLKLLVCLILILLVNTSLAAFSDVDSDHRFYDAVNYFETNEIVKGYDDGTYGVDRFITRAELTKVIILQSNFEVLPSAACFLDIVRDDWFSPYVCTAKSYRLVSGFADGMFLPQSNITRAEALKLILLGNKIKDYVVEDDFEFSLANETDWYYDILSFAKFNQIWFFDDDKNPNDKITRGEFAELFYQTLAYVDRVSEDELSEDDKEASNLPDEEEGVQDDGEDGVESEGGDDADGEDGDEVVESEGDNEDVGSSEPNSLLALDYKTYSTTAFDGVTLDSGLNNMYLENQTLNFSGTLDTNESEVLFALLDSETKKNVLSKVYPVENNQFNISMNLSEEGKFFLALVPGSGGTSKIYEVNVIDVSSFNRSSSNLDTSATVDFRFDNDLTMQNIAGEDGEFYEVVFAQDGKQVVNYSYANLDNSLDYKLFEDYQEGSVDLTIAKLEVDFENLEIVAANSLELDSLDAITHNFSELSEDVEILSLPSFYTLNQAIIVEFQTNLSFKNDYFLISPDGLVSEFKDQVVESEGVYSFTFTPNQEGTYILEVNDDAGLAIINHVIYQEGKTVLIPDYFDLFKLSGDKVDVNLMLNLINEARSQYGLENVVLNETLSNLSEVHLLDMVERNFFAHVNLDDESPQQRALDFGVNTIVGENLAKDRNTEKAFYSLMRSAVHRANILNASWTSVGLAIQEHQDYVYVVQEFSFEEQEVITAFDEYIETNLTTASTNAEIAERSSQWVDLMISEQNFATSINGDSVFDGLQNSGFQSFLTLIGARTDLDGFQQALNDSLLNLVEFAPSAYGLSVKFDGTGKYVFALIVAK